MSDSTSLKRCCRCGVKYPATPEFFRQNKSKKDGFHEACKVCIKKAEQESRRNRGILPKAYVNEKGERQCSYCGAWKPATLEFFRKTPGGVGAVCRECHNKHAVDWYNNHSEQAKESRYLYQLRHREELLIWHKQYRIEHPEVMREWRTNNSQRVAQNHRQWCKNHPDKVKSYLKKRYTRRVGLPFTLTKEQEIAALNYFGGRCAVCERQPEPECILVFDHWIPLVSPDCPGATPDNMIPLCHGRGGCNNSKQHKIASVWLQERFGNQKAEEIMMRIEAYFEAVKHGGIAVQHV